MVAQATQQVPYWLQLTTVLVAPAIGMVGVVFGSLHSGKRETGRWLAEKRFDLYTKFVDAATDANSFFWYTADPLLRKGDTLTEAHEQLLQYFRRADQLSREIGLVCSSGLRNAMYEVLDNLSYKCLLLQDNKFRAEESMYAGIEWVSMAAKEEGWQALLEFQQHSARELNVRDHRVVIIPQRPSWYHQDHHSRKLEFRYYGHMHSLK
jgi:hypothetical protein